MPPDNLKIVLIAPPHPSDSLCDAWRRAISSHFPDPTDCPFEVKECRLDDLDIKFDCIMSPANSFGIMDGGFDYYLSRAFKGPSGDKWTLTEHVQSYLRDIWHGYAPPGTCTIVPLPDAVFGPGRNKHDARSLAIVPTMRVPDFVAWDLDLSYNAMWSVLVELDRWNRVSVLGGLQRINTIVMTGLGTGTGGVDFDVCARQMVLAAKHFWSPVPDVVRWNEAHKRDNEIKTARAPSSQRGPPPPY
ncbi:macro domain-like protein [Coniophora puteana RWD-64-598 SS2]|uniref:Macro domain-like protein n=1 Tax=Coniophora puteana (strain RWD-64-598) TaxID=741705 RepID=A0A5M3MAI5_CONPW|nr:macro domain-like protein [Coniophora puteana RWD-64-598 SS2]EIW76083.1 macro domain-like protein [Coniophora puteana RWD-64-598 SS2]